MIPRYILGVLLLACISCGANTFYYRDPSAKLFVLSDPKARGGQHGEIDPAVIEYVLASDEGPWVPYYQSFLDSDLTDQARVKLRHASRTVLNSGAVLSAKTLARARARLLSSYIIQGLRDTGTNHKPGVVRISSSGTSNRDTGQLESDQVETLLYLNRETRVIRLEWYDKRTIRVLTWDLSLAPSSIFSASSKLSYENVSSILRPLHRPQKRHY